MMLGEIQTGRPDGAPEGVSEVAITDRPLRALRIPRENASEAADLEDLQGFGIFFLVGPGARRGERPRVFIGGHSYLGRELTRLLDFPPFPWTAAVAVPLSPPKVARFHKELTKLMQFHCHRYAVRANHHQVVNPPPACPSLVPAFVDSDLKASRTGVQTLLFALGHPVLGTRLRVVK